jgi:hypothetical protein
MHRASISLWNIRVLPDNWRTILYVGRYAKTIGCGTEHLYLPVRIVGASKSGSGIGAKRVHHYELVPDLFCAELLMDHAEQSGHDL